jgi:hypothetical protein
MSRLSAVVASIVSVWPSNSAANGSRLLVAIPHDYPHTAALRDFTQCDMGPSRAELERSIC